MVDVDVLIERAEAWLAIDTAWSAQNSFPTAADNAHVRAVAAPALVADLLAAVRDQRNLDLEAQIPSLSEKARWFEEAVAERNAAEAALREAQTENARLREDWELEANMAKMALHRVTEHAMQLHAIGFERDVARAALVRSQEERDALRNGMRDIYWIAEGCTQHRTDEDQLDVISEIARAFLASIEEAP